MRTKIFTMLFIAYTAMQVFAQNIDKAKLDAYFDNLEKHDKFMGSVAVSRNGEIIYSRSVGFADGNVSYAMISNGTNFNNNNISIAVLSAVYEKPFEIPELKAFKISDEELDQNVGVYASTQIPLKITISKGKENLVAQATGQSAFPLEATEKDKFKFEQAGVVMEFKPAEKSMILKQGGGEFNFRME